MKKKLILVNQQDKPIGETDKLAAHLGKGKRHRAFTAILQNKQGKILLTHRSLKKPLWPTFWDFSFSSHPWVGESLEVAACRRGQEELGIIVTGFRDLLAYEYHAQWSKVFSEWEINHILLGQFAGKLKPDHEEISDFQWLSWGKAVEWLKTNREEVAPWTLLAAKEVNGTQKIKKHLC